VHKFYKTLIGTVATAALGAVLVAGAAQQALAQAQAAPSAQAEKRPKDTGESDLIQEVNKDLAGANQQKTITDLNAWLQKYPESDYKAERLAYFISTYAAMKQPDKVLDYADQLLAMDYKAALKDNKKFVLSVLYTVGQALPGAPTANYTAAELAAARKAAKALLDLAADANSRPSDVTEAQWADVGKDLKTISALADVTAALYPGSAAMGKKDYAGAEGPFQAAYKDFPDSGWVAYNYGSSLYSQKEADGAKRSKGLYLIARGVSMDPTKGGIADANLKKSLEDYLTKAYRAFHGNEEGLDQLKQQALASANPPADFKIKTVTEIAEEKQKQFEKEYPELAMWMKIKGMLTAPDGEQVFESQMKGTGLPKLKGTITGGKPECRSKEILVALPEPGQQGTLVPEITIKLDTALKGKPLSGEIVWENGVPSAFTKEPLMLTIDVEQAAIQGIKTDQCTPAAPSKKGPAKGAAAKKAAPKKK
jgi:hypothetical protein